MKIEQLFNIKYIIICAGQRENTHLFTARSSSICHSGMASPMTSLINAILPIMKQNNKLLKKTNQCVRERADSRCMVNREGKERAETGE